MSAFFSLDGVDGCGKSTQCRLLVEWLRARGHDVVLCHDPGGTEVGTVLRGLLLDQRGELDLTCEAFLFMASRAQLLAEVIRPALEVGKVVVSDRFLLANVVYQGHGGGLDPDRLLKVARFAAGGLEPDVTFVLDLPLDLAKGRRKPNPDRMERRDEDYQRRVHAGFRAEAARRSERIRLVDASAAVDEVQQVIRQEVERVLGKHPRA